MPSLQPKYQQKCVCRTAYTFVATVQPTANSLPAIVEAQELNLEYARATGE